MAAFRIDNTEEETSESEKISEEADKLAELEDDVVGKEGISARVKFSHVSTLEKKLAVSDPTRRSVKWAAEDIVLDVKLRGSEGNNRAVIVSAVGNKTKECVVMQKTKSTKSAASKSDPRKVFGFSFSRSACRVGEKKPKPDIYQDTFEDPDSQIIKRIPEKFVYSKVNFDSKAFIPVTQEWSEWDYVASDEEAAADVPTTLAPVREIEESSIDSNCFTPFDSECSNSDDDESNNENNSTLKF